MYSIILSLALSQPAQFEINLETNTDVVILIQNNQIHPNQIYQINEQIVPITIKYLSGEDIIIKEFELHLIPGKYQKFNLKILARPPTIAQV